ncbi:MAG: zinc ribbon domain-containing protein [Nocardioides sp.]
MQELDSRLDQIRHQLRTLPETSQLTALATERAALEDQVRDARIRVDDLAKEQRKADADVEQVKTRRKRDQDRMDAGQVTNPKDLARMQQELVSLDRRISNLEDEELEVMEQLEAAQAELAELTARAEAVDAQTAELADSRGKKAAALEAEAADLTRQRGPVADGVPKDLLALYTKVRDQKGGVGAAPLRARRCGGCSLELNAADMGVIAKAPTDEVLRCEECNRILVRTSESGI